MILRGEVSAGGGLDTIIDIRILSLSAYFREFFPPPERLRVIPLSCCILKYDK